LAKRQLLGQALLQPHEWGENTIPLSNLPYVPGGDHPEAPIKPGDLLLHIKQRMGCAIA